MAVAKKNKIITGGDVPLAISRFLQKTKYSPVFIICDENTLRHCLPPLIAFCPALADSQVIELEAGEQTKSIQVCEQVWKTLLEENAGKQSLVVNLGGGVVCDTGGFCASVYKRGIPFINIPTTLLAMADASVGGKNGINADHVKNAIGTITQPEAVFVNPAFLDSLSPRHYLNGLAEIYKIALVADLAFWKKLTGGGKFSTRQMIAKSVALKNKIVLRDLQDTGTRKILNFGHTIAHAIESVAFEAGGDVLHGEAVVAGMVAESHLAFQKKLITGKQLSEITTALQNTFTSTRMAGMEVLLPFIRNDKKILSKRLALPLINGIGRCKTEVEVSEAQIRKAIAFYQSIT
jgi:3-dehydroquinate synthase